MSDLHKNLAILETHEWVQVGESHDWNAAQLFHTLLDHRTRQDGRATITLYGRRVLFFAVRSVDDPDPRYVNAPKVQAHDLSISYPQPAQAKVRKGARAPSRTLTKYDRPQAGEFTTWQKARTVAKARNILGGRGHRAVKCRDGQTFAVIFRPVVASNKQRRTRVAL